VTFNSRRSWAGMYEAESVISATRVMTTLDMVLHACLLLPMRTKGLFCVLDPAALGHTLQAACGLMEPAAWGVIARVNKARGEIPAVE